LSEYIQLQKEIKRLNADNEHLIEENRELSMKLQSAMNRGRESSNSSSDYIENELKVSTLLKYIFKSSDQSSFVTKI
jgi:hypothetical protein